MLFKNERFGLFVHWGIYAVGDWHEQEQWRRRMKKEDYMKKADQFSPNEFDPEQWVKTALEAGMEYICFTTKHHDGFCMWDTKQTDYNVMNTPYGQDVLKQLERACRKHNMKLALYYSVADWHQKNSINFGGNHQLPAPNEGDEPNEELYKAYLCRQIEELLTGYGRIEALFWDTTPYNRDDSINEFVRSLQPHILINDRGYSPGDYSTPEREIPPGKKFSCLTEACQSVGEQSWGYRRDEDYFSHRFLMESIDAIMSRGGNYLLNVGPMPSGRFTSETLDSLQAVGKWYKNVQESYVGAEMVEQTVLPYLLTSNGNDIYVHLSAPVSSGISLRPIDILPKRALLLNDGRELPCEVEFLPSFFSPYMPEKSYLHIKNIPVNELSNEVLIIKLSFDSGDEALSRLKQKGLCWSK